MNFLSLSMPMGRFFGISVRIHFTFFLYAFYRLHGSESYLYDAAVLLGLYACILLHEFGHSLATRFCGGDADEIIIWPLGGLALCRPIFHPTAQLITTAAGPLVTLVLSVLCIGIYFLVPLWQVLVQALPDSAETVLYARRFFGEMGLINAFLLVFNLIPAFPMDGGRIFLELLWYKLGFERAARIAVRVSQAIAVAGMVVGFGGFFGGKWLGFLSLLIFFESSMQAVAMAVSARVQPFSLKECFRQRKKRREFFQAVQEAAVHDVFHCCKVCGRTEVSNPELHFRVSADGEEYCTEHLPSAR